MNSNPSQMRRLAGLLVGAIVVGAILWIAYQFIARPKVTVSAPAGSIITLRQLGSGAPATERKATSNSTAIMVNPGNYRVTVSTDTAKQLFYTTLAPFKHQSFAVTASPELTAAIVTNHVAYDAVQSGSAISFLNTSDRAIETMFANGSLAQFNTTAPISSFSNGSNVQGIHVIAGNAAIVQINNQLYLLRDNALNPLNTTNLPGQIQTLVIGTNEQQSSFAVGINHSLYWYSSPDAQPQKLLDLNKWFDQLAVGGNSIIAYSTRLPVTSNNVRSDYKDYAIDPILIDVAAKSSKVFTSGPIVDASIATDGNHATLEPQQGSTMTLYSVANGSKLYEVENPSITTPQWLDATHFVYGKDGDIWNFDITAKTASVVGTLPNNAEATSITYQADTQSYLATVYNGPSDYAIYRLSNSAADANAEKAAQIAAAAADNPLFTLQYVNISQPTVIIDTKILISSPSPDQSRSASYASRQAALDYLQSSGVNPGKLKIVFNPANP